MGDLVKSHFLLGSLFKAFPCKKADWTFLSFFIIIIIIILLI